MSEPRIAVYVAREPFIGYIPGHIGNIRAGRIVVASHPGVALYPDKWRLLGTVDPDTARMIEALGDEATVKTVPMSMILAPVDTTEVAGDGPRPDGWSPPGIPDFAGAYRECIAALTDAHAPLTWESVAAWLQETYDPPRRRKRGTDQYADLHWKTVAGWADRAGLSHPRKAI